MNRQQHLVNPEYSIATVIAGNLCKKTLHSIMRCYDKFISRILGLPQGKLKTPCIKSEGKFPLPFKLLQLKLSTFLTIYKSFLHSGWSPEGCHVEWSNETHTGCACSHLTNFAILMDVHGVALSPAHQLALQTITYIGCGISTVALGAAMFVFMCFRNGKVRYSFLTLFRLFLRSCYLTITVPDNQSLLRY